MDGFVVRDATEFQGTAESHAGPHRPRRMDVRRFIKLVESGKRKDGSALAEFMPVDFIRGMDETERHALWAYLQSLPARPFGGH